MLPIRTETDLVRIAVNLGARSVPGWSCEEQQLADQATRVVEREDTARFASLIAEGHDPLGDAFCLLRSPEERRPVGATYTPAKIVEAMIAWARTQPTFARLIDPGTGSGRFLSLAGPAFPSARLVGVEIDPVAAIVARANLAVRGLAGRSEILLGDYREVHLPEVKGRTLFIGNPPYVRHHLLGPKWKAWLTATAKKRGLDASQLAGLHVHFFLATAERAKAKDVGVFITAAEWLDVNYGRLVRELLLGELGVRSLHVVEPTASPFPDAATTAVIACFEPGSRPKSVGLRRVETIEELGRLEAPRKVRRERLEAAPRWTPLTRPTKRGPAGYVELGEICRVHRGQVTGANKVWIAGSHSEGLPESVMFPSVTKAKELFGAGRVLADADSLRRVIDLPVDLDVFEGEERRRINRFLAKAKAMGADSGFVAKNRRAWWSVGLRTPAPILATYMARRPPAFVRNAAAARHINIAHGLYPRETLAARALDKLAEFLSKGTALTQGRTYAGGLTKFEPKEMERLLVPGPELLLAGEISP